MFFGKKPAVKHFQTFGQKAFVLNKKPQKGKFDARSNECIFIGYCDEQKVYRLWDPEAKTIVTSRDVKFINEFENSNDYELEFFYPELPKTNVTEENISPQSEPPVSDVIGCKQEIEETENETYVQESGPPSSPLGSVPDSVEEKSTNSSSKSDLFPHCISASSATFESAPNQEHLHSDENKEDIWSERGQPGHGRGRPRKIKTGLRGRPRKEYSIKNEHIEEAQIAEESINPSLTEALNGTNANEWYQAMKKEHDALVKNKAWKIVKRPDNKKVIGSRWVLRTKFNPDGTISQRKARLVAKGFSQIPHVDYE
ncbi:retrotransposon 4 protein, partial [Lasius niger]